MHFQYFQYFIFIFLLLHKLPERCKNYIKHTGEKEISENAKNGEERNFQETGERLMKRVDPDRNNRRIFDVSYADRTEKNEYISLSSRSLTIIPVLFDFSSHLPASASPQPLHHVFMAV